MRDGSPFKQRLGGYKSTGIMTTQAAGLHVDIGQQVALELERKLREKKLFNSVFVVDSLVKQDADLLLYLRFTEINDVTDLTRNMSGAFAGRAKVAAKVSLVTAKGNEEIGSFYAEGLSSGGSIFAGTTPDAVQEFVNQTVAYVEKQM